MNKTHATSRILIAALPVLLSACGTIKSYFPDKEKDYQFTTEIPVLILPPDLDTNTAPVVAAAEPVSTSELVKQTVKEVTEVVESVVNPKQIKAELVKFDNGEVRLRVDTSLTRAWREVGRALSRRSLEITYRNQDEGLFRVQYDPDEQPVEDGSLWDEIVFIFIGVGGNEQEYTIKLVEHKQQTEVAVLNPEGQPLSEGAGLRLLTLLQETINADNADQAN